jgi:hypothetical protein
MKKLMLTTAIASVLTTAAIAQTTITGEIRINYKAVGAEAASGTVTTSGRGFGNEAQINVQTKGKLNVGGLDYAAGFALENDGVQTTSLFNENTYIDLTNASSGTTISFSQDHIQRSDTDRSAAVLVGFTPNELSTNGPSGTRFNQNLGPAVSQSFGIAVLQATPIGTFSYNYAPTLTDQSATVTTTGSAASENALGESDRESGYEYGFVGDLGVKGLNAYYFKSAENSPTSGTTVKSEARSWGANYNFGQISVGYADKKYNLATSATAIANANDITEKHYGAAYAVSNVMTIGALYGKAEIEGNANTQKVKALQLGYALGPVDLTASVARNSDIGGVLGADSDMAMIRFIGKF